MMRSPSDMAGQARLAYVIDDERDVRTSLTFLLKTFGISSRPFASAEDFLAELLELRPGCVIVDVRMPGKDGLTMLAELESAHIAWPAIVITGHSEIPTAVRAMKLGATEFLEKPFSETDLIAALERGFEHLSSTAHAREFEHQARLSIGGLTPRERLVLEGVVAGLSNKQIAAQAGLSSRTVEMHRTKMMRRARVSTMAELVSMAHAAGVRTAQTASSHPPAHP